MQLIFDAPEHVMPELIKHAEQSFQVMSVSEFKPNKKVADGSGRVYITLDEYMKTPFPERLVKDMLTFQKELRELTGVDLDETEYIRKIYLCSYDVSYDDTLKLVSAWKLSVVKKCFKNMTK